MSFFSSMFGGSSTASKKELPKKAIADMRVQIEMLQKKAKHLESQIEEQNAIARKNVTTNKNRKSFFQDSNCYVDKLMLMIFNSCQIRSEKKENA